MTPAQKQAIESLRSAVARKVTNAMNGYTIEISVDDAEEILALVDWLKEEP